MGVFDDKKFEGLDWISQATEPIDSELNEVLEKLPESFDIDFNTYVKITKKGYGLELSTHNVVAHVLEDNGIDYNSLSNTKFEELLKCFKFEYSQQDMVINFETSSIEGGTLKLVKTATTIDEDTLKNILGREGVNSVAHMGFIDGPAISRANEIMELLGGCEVGLRTRSPKKKRIMLKERLELLFKNNEWNIRDTKLADKVGTWITDYVKEGNLAALSNFCRLKVMTHKNQPIYSMEEVE